jgi:hypothetical protein
MTLSLILTKWCDLHAHSRQDDLLKPMAEQHIRMGCAGALGMPNTKPPLALAFSSDETATAWSVERYGDMLNAVEGAAGDRSRLRAVRNDHAACPSAC